jgi:hypothetical protein
MEYQNNRLPEKWSCHAESTPPPVYSRMIPGEADMDAALIMV